MMQQMVAIVVILFFVIRLLLQKKRMQVSGGEFLLWLVFWIVSLIAILFIKKIDLLVSYLGFSASGIDVLLYLVVVVLLYFVFRLRIKIEKMDRDMTKIVREISINNKK